tara:strand:+ start:128551 stop:129000 length:450 start_codon:yes stop_codon:yes gene_type:complete
MSDSAFGFKEPGHSPGFMLWQSTITWQRLIKAALDEHNISHAQFVIMACLLWFDETQQTPIQSAIVNMTKLDKMTVSQALKKLVHEALVARKENAIDTRAKSVTLTKAGKSLIKKLVPIVEAVDNAYFAPLNQKEISTLNGLLKRLTQE